MGSGASAQDAQNAVDAASPENAKGSKVESQSSKESKQSKDSRGGSKSQSPKVTPKGSKASKRSGDEDEEDAEQLQKAEDERCATILSRLAVVPYGVLGLQLGLDKQERRKTTAPTDRIAYVDAAGIHHIHGSPQGAGGSAGAIYKHLGIYEEKAFTPDVVEGIAGEGDAFLHSYADQHVIHAVGPDFRQEPYSSAVDEREALDELSRAYYNIFREYAALRLPRAMPFRCLRLLPLSGGVFSGRYQRELPRITMACIGQGFAQLGSEERQRVLGSERLELCIFLEAEHEKYEKSLQTVLVQLQPAPDVKPLPSMVSTTSIVPMASVCDDGGGLVEPEFEADALQKYSDKFEGAVSVSGKAGTGLSRIRDVEPHSPRQEPPECPHVGTMKEVKAVAKKKREATAKASAPPPLPLEPKPWQPGGGGVLSAEDKDEEKSLHFDSKYKAMTVKLSPDHQSASWQTSRFGGFVMAEKPLRKRVFGRWFEVQIDEVEECRWNDGLGIGISVKPKWDHFKFDMNAFGQLEGMACEMLPDSWMLGYDGVRAKMRGRSRYLTNSEMPEGLWKPSTLRGGDLVGIMVTPEGHIFLFVNDELRILVQNCEGLEKLGRSPLYATIDLDGCTKTVHFQDSNGLPSLKVQQIHGAFREAEYRAKIREGKVNEDTGRVAEGSPH